MTTDIKQMIADKKELEEKTKELDKYATDLLERRYELVTQIAKFTDRLIKPRKDEIAQIEAEITNIMKGSGVAKLSSDHMGAYLKDKLSPKITDKELFITWIKDYPQVLSAKSFNVSQINSLIDEGVVIDPQLAGIDINITFQTVEFRKRD